MLLSSAISLQKLTLAYFIVFSFVCLFIVGSYNSTSIHALGSKSLAISSILVRWEMDVKQNDYIIPGGSMIATIKDVGIFLRALIDGSLLDIEEQAIYSSIYKYEHTGLLPGYHSIARYQKDIDAVIILFINTSGNSWSKTESIYKKIVKAINKGGLTV